MPATPQNASKRSWNLLTALLALTAVAHVALAVWVRRDARRRGVDPSPWAALTLLTGVVGAIAYRHRRSD